MKIDVTINDITGSSPYDVYICDSVPNVCLYINTINSLPYTFNIPIPFNTQSSYKVKVIDNNGCEIIKTITV
jgi:hypothetical protein